MNAYMIMKAFIRRIRKQGSENRIRGYRKFRIYDPKEREIHALPYSDRVVQHSLCDNVLGPYLDRRLIYDNAACRPGKGTHFAMDRLSGFMRSFYREHGADGWFLKCDIRKYFLSISHRILHEKIEGMNLGAEVKELLHIIVDSYEEEEGRGLPMGNQTSQWFALYYLDGIDRLVKEKMRIKYYTRYMDDMILIHHDREYLSECLCEMEAYAKDRLDIEFNEKTQIHHIKQGIDYLGFHFYLTDTGKVIRRLRQSCKRRFKRKLKKFKVLYRNDNIGIDDKL